MRPETAEDTLRPTWSKVDGCFEGLLAPADPTLERVLEANRAAGLPSIDVSPLQGRMLTILALACGARRVLELGTLGGYSTVCLARGINGRPGARIVTLESHAKHAETARANFAVAGLESLIDLRLGPAADSLNTMVREGESAFDLIFIDADKSSYPTYLDLCLKLARPGTLLIADNVVRHGEVANPASTDPNVVGVRRFSELLAVRKDVVSTAVQTVGVKGYDGFVLAVVA
ncbi:MAG: O-methyltransferase [Phycisphaerales bacterium]|nr:O-methyltransferase [Phycisphaerales bacterium]